MSYLTIPQTPLEVVVTTKGAWVRSIRAPGGLGVLDGRLAHVVLLHDGQVKSITRGCEDGHSTGRRRRAEYMYFSGWAFTFFQRSNFAIARGERQSLVRPDGWDQARRLRDGVWVRSEALSPTCRAFVPQRPGRDPLRRSSGPMLARAAHCWRPRAGEEYVVVVSRSFVEKSLPAVIFGFTTLIAPFQDA